jgi:hypothetical protein
VSVLEVTVDAETNIRIKEISTSTIKSEKIVSVNEVVILLLSNSVYQKNYFDDPTCHSYLKACFDVVDMDYLLILI